jgi:hypothetical protein
MLKRLLTASIVALCPVVASASSHREAPLITASPKLDCSDFYLFNSYEPGRSNHVTLVANYLPLQDAYGGPNYFQLDPDAVYEIHVDNNGDAVEDLTFRFRFTNTPRGFGLPVGPEGNRRTNDVPVLAVGAVTAADQGALLVDQTYTLGLVRGPRRTGAVTPIANAAGGSTTFTKPQDFVGTKTFPDYDAYANAYVYEIALPGTERRGKLFVGQRKDPFVVNLGETFDLINISTSPLGPEDANRDSLRYKNVTALVLELPTEFLVGTNGPVIGAWTTASRVSGETSTQVSRLSMPLVNEVVIGLRDKDRFNASEPKDDLQFADYVTHPTLPAIIELLYGAAGVRAPISFPRNDLLSVFVTGVAGLNANGSIGEMQRLNTSIPPTPRERQANMGVLAGDLAGFPNGRRPGDDVVDMALRVVMGALLPATNAPSGTLPFTDGATVNASFFPDRFPYLASPVKGSPNPPEILVQPSASASLGGPSAPVAGSYDPATRRISVPAPSGGTGFISLESDGKLRLSQVRFEDGRISARVE